MLISKKRRHIYASWPSPCPTLLGPLCPMELKNQGQQCPTEAEFTSLFANKVRERERWTVSCTSAPGRHADPAHWAHHILVPGIWPSQIRVHFFGGKRTVEGRDLLPPYTWKTYLCRFSSTSIVSQKHWNSVRHTWQTYYLEVPCSHLLDSHQDPGFYRHLDSHSPLSLTHCPAWISIPLVLFIYLCFAPVPLSFNLTLM